MRSYYLPVLMAILSSSANLSAQNEDPGGRWLWGLTLAANRPLLSLEDELVEPAWDYGMSLNAQREWFLGRKFTFQTGFGVSASSVTQQSRFDALCERCSEAQKRRVVSTTARFIYLDWPINFKFYPGTYNNGPYLNLGSTLGFQLGVSTSAEGRIGNSTDDPQILPGGEAATNNPSHFLSIGVGYLFKSRLKASYVEPYFSFSANEVIQTTRLRDASNRLNRLQAARVVSFGIRFGSQIGG